MAYGPHPSRVLGRCFEARPYQGAHPGESEFIFVGLDANFALDVEASANFDDLKIYLEDGIAYWKRTGRHHPFVDPSYRGSGKRYHQQSAKIGFTTEDASRISFVELAHVPTYGSGSPNVIDLQPAHLDRLEGWMTDGAAKYVFMPLSVVRLLHQTKRMRWLDLRSGERWGSLPVIGRRGDTMFFAPYHLSYRYAPTSARQQQLADIHSLGMPGRTPRPSGPCVA